MSKHKHFEVQRAGDVCVVHLIDPKLFDTLIVTELQDDLMELIDTEQPGKLVVNFASVTHCSTAVINSLLRAKKKLLSMDGTLKLSGMSSSIREAYKMLNLDGTVFQIYDKPSDAIEAFSSE